MRHLPYGRGKSADADCNSCIALQMSLDLDLTLSAPSRCLFRALSAQTLTKIPSERDLPYACPYSRQGRHYRFRPGRLHRRDLCRPRDAGADPDPGHPAWRPAHHHHRRGELPRLCRRDPGSVADGADGEAGGPCRHQDRHRSRHQARTRAAAVPADLRQRRRLSGGDRHPCHRRAGALARHAFGREIQGFWRIGLRDLRRIFLSRQGGRRGRRRQHRGRGSAVPDQFRLAGDHRASPRSFPRRAHPAGPPVQASQDQGGLGQRDRRNLRQRESGQGHPCPAEERQDRRAHASCRPTASSSRSVTRPRPTSSPARSS